MRLTYPNQYERHMRSPGPRPLCFYDTYSLPSDRLPSRAFTSATLISLRA